MSLLVAFIKLIYAREAGIVNFSSVCHSQWSVCLAQEQCKVWTRLACWGAQEMRPIGAIGQEYREQTSESALAPGRQVERGAA